MSQNVWLKIGALNIVADPHPTGIYRSLFQEVAEQAVQVWGNDWAKITAPDDRGTDPPSFYGRVLVWTEMANGSIKPQIRKRRPLRRRRFKFRIISTQIFDRSISFFWKSATCLFSNTEMSLGSISGQSEQNGSSPSYSMARQSTTRLLMSPSRRSLRAKLSKGFMRLPGFERSKYSFNGRTQTI